MLPLPSDSKAEQILVYRPHFNGESFRCEFGAFKARAISSYDAWGSPKSERNRFTGEISFTHDVFTGDDFPTSTVVSSFIYVDGKLVKKDGGYLPG